MPFTPGHPTTKHPLQVPRLESQNGTGAAEAANSDVKKSSSKSGGVR
jgi:hypothetical protein